MRASDHEGVAMSNFNVPTVDRLVSLLEGGSIISRLLQGEENAQHSSVCIAKLLSIMRGKGQI